MYVREWATYARECVCVFVCVCVVVVVVVVVVCCFCCVVVVLLCGFLLLWMSCCCVIALLLFGCVALCGCCFVCGFALCVVFASLCVLVLPFSFVLFVRLYFCQTGGVFLHADHSSCLRAGCGFFAGEVDEQMPGVVRSKSDTNQRFVNTSF